MDKMLAKVIEVAKRLGWEPFFNKHLEELIYFIKDDIYSVSLYKNDIIHGIEEEIETKTSDRYKAIYGWGDYNASYIPHLTELLETLKREIIA